MVPSSVSIEDWKAPLAPNWSGLVTRAVVRALSTAGFVVSSVTALAMAEPVQWLAASGGPASVMATMRSATSGLSGGMREGRVLSRQSPAAPSSRNRSCERQITVLVLPVVCTIAAVPQRSAVKRMIFARQTSVGCCGWPPPLQACCGRWRSIGYLFARACRRLAHASPAGESPSESKC